MNTPGYAVWLYGSHARGVADCHSDLDILVAGDHLPNNSEVRRHFPWASDHASVSHYAWHEIEQMAEYGSLFLQHLRLEAIPIYETPSHRGNLQRVLNGLGDYRLAERDLRGFRAVLDDVAEALDSESEETYELAVLGTVIRHATILGCWLLKQPSFGRLEPVSSFVNKSDLDQLIEKEFQELYSYRLYIDGRVEREALGELSARQWLERARQVVKKVEGLALEGA